MPTQGNFTLFEKALKKFQNAAGPINLSAGSPKAVLTTATQALSSSFVGSSTDARYADLTNELTTANGYTAGGLALSGLTIGGSGNTGFWAVNPFSWTLSGSITFKYLVVYDNAAPNKDLLLFVDFDVGGSNITALTGLLQITPGANGLFKWVQ